MAMLFLVHVGELWFPEFNRAILEVLFHLVRHTALRVTVAEYLVEIPLFSSWVYAAVFYFFWRLEDDRTIWRRVRLLEVVLACLLSVLLTLLLRPWVGWPAPVNVPVFQSLYPAYIWGHGAKNCFPSHSTLVYFLVAIGMWPFSRRLTLFLVVLVLATISFPRIYIGGHYPIDVVASVVLALLTSWMVRSYCRRPKVFAWLVRAASAGLVSELLLFFWLFELAEGFGSIQRFYSALLHLPRHMTLQIWSATLSS